MTRKKRSSRPGRRRPRPRQKGMGRRLYVAILIVGAFLLCLGGAWLLVRRRDTGATEIEVQLAPVSQLSEKVRRAPPVVQEAYRFAIANPEVPECVKHSWTTLTGN